jgi:small subunit ribosomal protein S19
MARSTKKGVFVHPHLLTKVIAAQNDVNRKPIKTYSRSSCIIQPFVGLTFSVHNGKSFVPVFVTQGMVGHKLGEFVLTRIFKQHSGDKQAQRRV